MIFSLFACKYESVLSKCWIYVLKYIEVQSDHEILKDIIKRIEIQLNVYLKRIH